MEDCKNIKVPLDLKTKLKRNMNQNVEMVRVPYQQVNGSLMYAMCTRLDLTYQEAWSTHGQFMFKTLDYNQTHFSILARHLVIQIMI
jgi:hypothetical protein